MEKLPSWKQISRKLPLWAKHPVIIDSYTRLQQNTLPSIKVHSRRAYQDLRTQASTIDWPRTLISAAIFSFYLIFFGLYIHWFKVFIQDLAWFAYNGVDRHSWSFGQIVAISVWAEPLCEYFHLELRESPSILYTLPNIRMKTTGLKSGFRHLANVLLNTGGMTRGFEHRLWGYTVVRIHQPDTERNVVVSDSNSSVHRHLSSSSTTSLDDNHEMGAYGKLSVVEVRDGEHVDQGKGQYSRSEDGDLAMRPRVGSRVSSEDMDDLGRWQIPETVLRTGGSLIGQI